MRARRFSLGTLWGEMGLCLVAFALLLRVMLPAGFMPATGKGFAITLCTGMGAVSAWIDDAGNVHKGKAAPGDKIDHPCAFAGMAASLALPAANGPATILTLVTMPFDAAFSAVAIGRGLAAPPPPPTGPPVRL